MYRISPARFHGLSPRQRMVASLSGFGNSNSGTEVRGMKGNLLAVVPTSAPAKEMVSSILMGPSIAPAGQQGQYQVIERPAQYGWRDRPITNPPQTQRSSVESANYNPGTMVRRLAGFGFGFDPSFEVKPVQLPPGAESMTSRALPPPGGGVHPVMVEPRDPAVSVTEPLPGTNVPTVQPTPMLDRGAPTNINLTTTQPITQAPAGIPTWALGLGAAAVFGGIWYWTRR